MGLDLFQPVFHGVEGGAVIDCVGHYDAHSSFVVGLGDGLEAFLAGGVPYLHADLLAIDLYGFDLEVYALSKEDGTDGGQMGTHKVVLTESEEDVGLTDTTIADDKQLCKMIVTVLLHHYRILNNQPRLIINRDLIG